MKVGLLKKFLEEISMLGFVMNLFVAILAFASFEGFTEGLKNLALAAFTLGSLVFFVFWTFIVFICLFNAGIRNRYWVTGVLFFVLFVLFWILGVFSPFDLLLNHFWATLGIVSVYLLCGLIWMSIRWSKYIKKVRIERGVRISKYLREHFPGFIYERRVSENEALKTKSFDLKQAVANLTAEENQWYVDLTNTGIASEDPYELTENLQAHISKRDGWTDYNTRLHIGTATSAPKFGERKQEYFRYFFYWPVDITVFFLGEFLRDFWNYVVDKVQGAFNRYAEKYIKQKIDID